MRPIPATSLGDAHGLLRAIDKRGRLRTDEFVTEFSLEELFPPDLENALGRLRHFISYARAAGLVKEDRGVVELTEVGRRYIRAGDPDTPFSISSQQAEWLRRQLREKHMTDSIFHGLAIGLSLLASCPPGARVSTMDFGRSMAYLGRAGWDNDNTLLIQGERHLVLLGDMEMIDPDHRLTPTGEQVRGELTLPIHMSLIDLAAQLNPGGAAAVREAAEAEWATAAPAEEEPPAAAEEPPAEAAEVEEDNGYHTVIGTAAPKPADEEPRPPIVPRASTPAPPEAGQAPPAIDYTRRRSTPPPAVESSPPPVAAAADDPVMPPPVESVAPPVASSPPPVASSPPPVASSPPPAEAVAPPPVEPSPAPADPVAPPPVASSPPPAEAVAPPPIESSPPPAEAVAPPPVALSPPPAEAVAPPPVASSPPPAEAVAPPPVASSPPPAEAVAPPPVASSPPPAEAVAPPPVASSPPPADAVAPSPIEPVSAPADPVAPPPAAASSPPPADAVAPPPVASSPPAEAVAPPVASSPPPTPLDFTKPPRPTPRLVDPAGETVIAPAAPRAATPAFVEPGAIRAAAEAAGLRLPASVYANVAAALGAGKHLLLTGAPGSGKTTLALAITRAAAQAGHAHGATVVTGAPSKARLLDAAGRARWLIADELDQADLAADLGPLSTFLAGVPVAVERQEETAPADGWRIVATWNAPEPPKAAVLRRFATLAVLEPEPGDLTRLLHDAANGDAVAIRAVETIRETGVGTGVLLDAARHAAARNAAAPADAATLAHDVYEAYAAPIS